MSAITVLEPSHPLHNSQKPYRGLWLPLDQIEHLSISTLLLSLSNQTQEAREVIAARTEGMETWTERPVTAGSAAAIRAYMSASVRLQEEALPPPSWRKLERGWTWAYPADAMVEGTARVLASKPGVPFSAPLARLVDQRAHRARSLNRIDRMMKRDQPRQPAPAPPLTTLLHGRNGIKLGV